MANGTIGQIEPFDYQQGDDWPTYVERLEQYFQANNIANAKKVATLLTVVGPKTYSLMRDLLAPANNIAKKVATLLTVVGPKTYSLMRNLLAPAKPAEKEMGLFTIKAVTNQSNGGIFVTPDVNGVPLRMELDTSASVSLISIEVWQSDLKGVPLESPRIVLKTYTGEKLEFEGQVMVQVRYQDQEATLPLLVVKGTGPSLLGRNWLQIIRLNWGEIKHVSSELDNLIAKVPEVFKEGLGTVRGCQVKLSVKEGATPKFFKPHSVPFALKETIEQDLDRLEQLQVITKVNYSEWAAPSP